MTPDEVTSALERTGALLTGHFQLTSGMHSERYIQGARALMHPDVAETLGCGIAGLFAGERIDLVAGPALGGIIIAHEVARALKVPCIFSERQTGKMTIRRGFAVPRDGRILLVEDVVTTGGSVLELAALVESQGGAIVGYGCIVDRSGGNYRLPEAPRALLKLSIATYDADACPLCRAGSRAIKPGSRAA